MTLAGDASAAVLPDAGGVPGEAKPGGLRPVVPGVPDAVGHT